VLEAGARLSGQLRYAATPSRARRTTSSCE
jgi:hypothetical protein